MFRSILVANDGSPAAQAALAAGIQLAKSLKAGLASLSVEESLPRFPATIDEVEEAKEDIDEHARKVTEDARTLAVAGGVEVETLVRQGHEVEMILRAVRERRVDLLVIGYQGHSRIFERLLGSTALSLARLAPCSVLVVRPRGPVPAGGEPIKYLVVGVDGSPHGRIALQAALQLGTLFGGTVSGLTILEGSPLRRVAEPEEAYARQVQTASAEHARAAGVPFDGTVQRGHAVQAVCDHAERNRADLIVLGATGLAHPWSAMIGGTATGVATQAPCSVLLVRAPQAALQVRDVMVRAVSSARVDAPLVDVLELLLRRNVKAVPVTDYRRHVVGIVTGGDLLRRGGVHFRLSIQRELSADTLRDQLRDLARSEKTARDVMTRAVRTVHPEADLTTAIRVMVGHRVKRLPVVDRDGELIGIVSRADVLRAMAALPGTTMPAELETRAARTVGEAMTTDIPVVTPEASAEDVLTTLLASPLRRVIVTARDRRVQGLISDRDVLLRAGPDVRPWILRVLAGRPPAHRLGEVKPRLVGPQGPLTAGDLMAPALFTVRPEDTLVHAIRLMLQHQVKRLVVVDADGRLLGLADRRELLRSLILCGQIGERTG